MTCRHPDTAPVEILVPGTFTNAVVAHVCMHCLEQLSANWGCTDCEWEHIETRRLRDPLPEITTVCTRLCPRHQEDTP